MRRCFEVIVYLLTGSLIFAFVEGRNRKGTDNTSCDNKPVHQTAYVGGSVNISCRYPPSEARSIKSLLKEDERSELTHCVSADTSPLTVLGRFTLRDDSKRGVYTVTISQLTQEDAGKYVCSVRRPGDQSLSDKSPSGELPSNDSVVCRTEIPLRILSWDAVSAVNFSHVTTENAQIKCNYSDQYTENQKYFCKGSSPLNCKKLQETRGQGKDAGESRFNIRDSRRMKHFLVNIRNLIRDDSGTYWCISEWTRPAEEFTKIQLSVAECHTKTKRSGGSRDQKVTHDDDHQMDEVRKVHLGIGVGVGAGLLLLLVAAVVIVFILQRRKLSRKQVCCAPGGSSDPTADPEHNAEEQDNHNYEEINLSVPPAGSLSTLYATVGDAASDLLQYSTISFMKVDQALAGTDTNSPPAPGSGAPGAAGPPEPVESLYSSINLPQQ